MEKIQVFLDKAFLSGMDLGKSILVALIIYLIGRYVIKFVNKLVLKVMEKRDLDLAIRTFVGSLVNISLRVLLIISVVGALGVETTSFAALLASFGVAIGMALSGNLQNFAGGLIVLLFKPYKIGDYIETQTAKGTVKEIQIFHTILITPDNKIIFVPNGALSNGAITNYTNQENRRVDWTFGIEYGTDFKKVKNIILELLKADSRILDTPESFIALGELADNSINITIRAWTKNEDYWNVFYDVNQKIYETFNKEAINFPFPQLVIHQK